VGEINKQEIVAGSWTEWDVGKLDDLPISSIYLKQFLSCWQENSWKCRIVNFRVF
jgi:hypothetical protein